MDSKKKLPTGLAKKQELKRQETINKVLRAMADLKNEGRKVTISALVEFTGLSRSTFAKPHVRELFMASGGTVRGNTTPPCRCKKDSSTDIISEKDRLIAELRVKNEELERECELLRGRLFLAMQR